ncbi:hypothetical protein [Streptomyces kanamyceticus]|uniref:DUF320 domain-containing protein n=1 Tax=Streptomyces kanamyceticus TaxID=1967 RepID=A0A5J6G5I4_STRKN|nr:hypothetical protein [Streptomyces kanamyceticus]QEU89844.1 hypothetical protein CP970_01805 [Streptomyces kanamyceticus]
MHRPTSSVFITAALSAACAALCTPAHADVNRNNDNVSVNCGASVISYGIGQNCHENELGKQTIRKKDTHDSDLIGFLKVSAPPSVKAG